MSRVKPPCIDTCISTLRAAGYRVTKIRPRHRFQVVEWTGGYTIYDTWSEQERWLSDGVDVLFTPSGKAMRPGTERFRRAWQRSFNENPDETAEAYDFPAGRD